MKTSKNLKETSTHEQSNTGNNESSSNGQSNQSGKGSSTQHQSTTNTQNGKSSNLSDGVSQASIQDGYLTSTSSVEDKGNQTLSGSTSDNTEVKSSQNTSGTNNQVLTESTTFTSEGDIGIQTPAYAITEWRKVLININQMIIEECNDLFMKLY